jgi:YgiT-type zinc finger domain-containing protein
MSENENILPEPFSCNECHAGILRSQHVTYFTWLSDELVTVPHFPAWVCDMCGKREYDEKAIAWLNMILSPNAGKPTTNRQHTPPRPRPQTGASRPILDS